MTVRINLEKKYQKGSVKYQSVQPPFLLGVSGVWGVKFLKYIIGY